MAAVKPFAFGRILALPNPARATVSPDRRTIRPNLPREAGWNRPTGRM
jgi:hypothetical protein